MPVDPGSQEAGLLVLHVFELTPNSDGGGTPDCHALLGQLLRERFGDHRAATGGERARPRELADRDGLVTEPLDRLSDPLGDRGQFGAESVVGVGRSGREQAADSRQREMRDEYRRL